MSRQIFVNLPVKDLQRSIDFYTALGFSFNPKFTDENATCMIVADDVLVMLRVEPFFRSFIDKPLCDAKAATEVLLALSCKDRAEVDEMMRKALAAGGTAPRPPRDLGFMYSHHFEDLDGHIWEPFYMDEAQMP